MQPAKFHFKNIGPIKKAELELGDLTIIAGRNNTGKTYIVYTLYGFLKKWDTLPWRMEPDMDIETSEDTADRETIDEKRKKLSMTWLIPSLEKTWPACSVLLVMLSKTLLSESTFQIGFFKMNGPE